MSQTPSSSMLGAKLTAALLLVAACIPGMHANTTTVGGTATATGTTGTAGCPDPHRDSHVGGSTPTAECTLNECDECGECNIDGQTFLCPAAEDVTVEVVAVAEAPEDFALAPEEVEYYAFDYTYDSYVGEYAYSPEDVTGPVTGAFPRHLGPFGAPVEAPAPAPAFAPLGVVVAEECGALGGQCCDADLSCVPGLACNFFDSTDTVCVICGGEGDLCCIGEDEVFSCGDDGLACDFTTPDGGPTCVAADVEPERTRQSEERARHSEARTRTPREDRGSMRRM